MGFKRPFIHKIPWKSSERLCRMLFFPLVCILDSFVECFQRF